MNAFLADPVAWCLERKYELAMRDKTAGITPKMRVAIEIRRRERVVVEALEYLANTHDVEVSLWALRELQRKKVRRGYPVAHG